MRWMSGHLLRRLRKQADEALPDHALLYRRSLSADGYGGQTETLTRVGMFPCRVAPLNSVQSSEAIIAEKLAGERGMWLTLPYHADVRMDDRLTVVGGPSVEVIGTDEDRSWAISQRVLCKELT